MTSDEAGKMLAKENTGFSLDGSVSIPSWDRFGLERLLKYCGRPSFSSENIRWNGKKVTYKLPKPNRRGQTSIQLDPIEFIDRIATLIPISHRHRHHYFGAFAPNSPLRKLVVANAKRHPENFVPSPLKLLSDKVMPIRVSSQINIKKAFLKHIILHFTGTRHKAIATHPMQRNFISIHHTNRARIPFLGLKFFISTSDDRRVLSQKRSK